MVHILRWIRHKLARLLDDALKLSQAITLLNFTHRLPLQYLDLLADLREELLDKNSRTLLHKVRINPMNLIEARLVVLERLIILMLQILAHQCSELDRHELLLEDARVANKLARALDVANVGLVAARAELWSGNLARVNLFLDLCYLRITHAHDLLLLLLLLLLPHHLQVIKIVLG